MQEINTIVTRRVGMKKRKDKGKTIQHTIHQKISDLNIKNKVIQNISRGIVGLAIAILIGGCGGYMIGKYHYEGMGKKNVMELEQEANVLHVDNQSLLETIEGKNIEITAHDNLISELVDVNKLLQDTAKSEEQKQVARASDWKLRLVNPVSRIQEKEVVKLAKVEGYEVDARIVEPLETMLTAARKDGIGLIICSAYRSWQKQTTLFNNKMKTQMNMGKTYAEAVEATSEWVAIPGASEHQIGLALDIVSTEYKKLDEGQAKTPAAKWLAEHAHEYGFILRYPKGKKEETTIEYEPWHYRYVGIEAATEMKEKGITLEVYLKS